MAESFHERFYARTHDLLQEGLDVHLAAGMAWLEERVRQWPPAWGNTLHVLIYGDFDTPATDLTYPSLGITVLCKKQENTVVRGARTVLEATVQVGERSIPALIDATRRINLLLGAYSLYTWGNAGYRWWSWLTHEGSSGSPTTLTHEGIERTITSMLNLPEQVRKKVEAALFWVREPRNLWSEAHRSDILRVYASYWNAFECLVDAVGMLKPRPKSSKAEKQAQIDAFVHQHGGVLTAENIQDCYRLVDPGFAGKASHALSVCFGSAGERYAEECFHLPNYDDRLYNIRNAINHGEVDAENPTELLQVDMRLERLRMIVWRMFGFFVPFPVPGYSREAG